jgi:hypothetical protein
MNKKMLVGKEKEIFVWRRYGKNKKNFTLRSIEIASNTLYLGGWWFLKEDSFIFWNDF